MRALPTLLLAALALLGWGLAAWRADSPPLPGPWAVAVAAWLLAREGPLLADVVASLGRVLDRGVVTSVVVMNQAYKAANPGADERFMAALGDAYGLYRDKRSQADAWFVEAAGVAFDPAVLALAASVEPNLEAGARISTTLSEADLVGMDKAAAFMLEAGLLKRPADVRAMVAQPGGSAQQPVKEDAGGE